MCGCSRRSTCSARKRSSAFVCATSVRRLVLSVPPPASKNPMSRRWPAASRWTWSAPICVSSPLRRWRVEMPTRRRCFHFAPTCARPAVMNAPSTRWTTANDAPMPARNALNLFAAWLIDPDLHLHPHSKGKIHEPLSPQPNQGVVSCSIDCALACISGSAGANRTGNVRSCQHAARTNAEGRGRLE